MQLSKRETIHCEISISVQECWFGEICVLYVLQPTFLKIPDMWYKLCVKLAERQNDEIYHSLRTSHFSTEMLVWWNVCSVCPAAYIALIPLLKNPQPVVQILHKVCLTYKRRNTGNMYRSLQTSVHNCWFGEICVRTVAYMVLQSPTKRINYVLSLLKFKTTFAFQSRNAGLGKYMETTYCRGSQSGVHLPIRRGTFKVRNRRKNIFTCCLFSNICTYITWYYFQKSLYAYC